MPFPARLRRSGTRRLGATALTVGFALLLAACGQNHPDSIFHQRTDFNRDVDFLFKILIYAGTAVFIFVEAILVITLIRYRSRPGQPAPKHVHGNTTLEITWTVVPFLILVLIAIPTVRTIFKTQAKARSDALQVEVIGHQWWWEFRYPQYGIVTANELYLPIGRTVNFTLRTQDVIHSFWVPALAGKRDLVSNHTNYLWYTPDSTTANAWNGACVEYCGTSHANMRFKTFTVTQADFESWAKHQQEPAAGTPLPGATQANVTSPTVPLAGRPGAGVPKTDSTPAPVAQVTQAGFIAFPREKLPQYAIPETPLPANLAFDDNLLGKGDPANGAKLIVGAGACLGCHTIKGNPMMVGVVGPNLTHIASRTTIAAGLYPNDARHLARWIKNARVMKPGVLMLTLGAGEYDPITKAKMSPGLTDQQIADIVAYLQTLK
ncbi:MAG TPA: cytochrome c oxidase subunit II [Gemmatimonadaceae bacterium]|jgi:cytochrome c oxidase subunit II|nr:cytochrome c oxidase subunit II [Gemmatimonadaceae bacterium]